MPKRPISLRIDDDLLAAADAFAAQTGTDRTALFARGLRAVIAGPRGAAPGTVAKGRHPSAAHAKPDGPVPIARPVNGLTAKEIARGYVTNAAGRRIPIDANGVPDFS